MEELDNHIQSEQAMEFESNETTDFEGYEDTEESYVETEYQEESQPQDEYDVIRYNKQEIKIPVSERTAYLQKGYNYDKLQSQYHEAQSQAQAIERIAKMQGYSNSQEFLRAVDEYEQEQRIQQEADNLGVDASVIRNHLNPIKTELEQLKRQNDELKRYEVQRLIEADIARMKERYTDFDQYENQIFDYASKGLDLEQAYRLASYDNVQKRIEQEVINRIKSRDGKQVLSSGDRGFRQKTNPGEMSFEELKAISDRVQRGERITF